MERVKKCIRVLLYTHTWPVLALHLMTAADEKADIFVCCCTVQGLCVHKDQNVHASPSSSNSAYSADACTEGKNQTSSLSLKVHMIIFPDGRSAADPACTVLWPALCSASTYIGVLSRTEAAHSQFSNSFQVLLHGYRL